MLSKLSVKKPYTAIVILILVIVLGIVSFTRMTTDLLPDISLNYALVITTDPGASPSEVETNVTVPIEGAMGSVSNLKSIQSVSTENVSMVILEFDQSVNMDSVSLEMREQLDQIRDLLGDSVGSPMIMRLNPNMIPIMIAAVERDGYDSIEMTSFVEESLIGDFQSVEGVAQVSASGEITERIDITIKDELLQEANEKVADAVRRQFDEGKEALADAKAEIEDAKAEISDGKTQLEEGIETAAASLAEAGEQIASNQQTLVATRAELQTQLDVLNMAKSTLQGQIDSAQAEKDKFNAQIAELQAQLEATDLPEEEESEGAEDTQGTEQTQETEPTPTPEPGIAETVISDITEAAETTADTVEEAFEDGSIQAQIAALQVAAAGCDATIDLLQAGIDELQPVIDQMNSGIAQIDAALATLITAQSTMDYQQLMGIIELSNASIQIAIGELGVTQGETQIETNEEALNEQMDAAVEGADINNILTEDMVTQLLSAQNFDMPAGTITEDRVDYTVRVGDDFETIDEIKELTILDMGMDGLEPIKLKDVAEVKKTDNSEAVYAKINGRDGVLLTMQKQTGYSTGEVSDNIKERIEELEEEYDGLHVSIMMDQGVYIDLVVNSVLKNLLMGAVLAVIVLLIFLRAIKPTLIVAVSIPFSLMLTVTALYFSGITLNIITLSGLALGVGMLVDNSIVVIENIFRMNRLGIPPKKAAVQGARQMSGAIIASTLTTVCVFLPIVFTEGLTKQIFVDMGLTIAYALLSSLLIAMTFVPMAASAIKNKTEERPGRMKNFGERLKNLYGKAAYWCLGHRIIVIAGAIAAMIAVIFFEFQRGYSYFPTMESTQAEVDIYMPEGSTPEETIAMMDEVTSRIIDIEDIESIGAMKNDSSDSISIFSSTDTAGYLYLILKEDKELSGDELSDLILERTDDLDCTVSVSTAMMDMSALGSTGISVNVTGRDTDKLQEVAKSVAELLKQTEGLEKVRDGIGKTTEEIRITVDKDAAMSHSLTVAQVYMNVTAAMTSGQTSATVLSNDTESLKMYVKTDNAENFSIQDLEELTFTVTKQTGETEKVALKDIAEISYGQGLASINRKDQTKYLSVTAVVKEGYNATLISNELQKELDNMDFPAGYTYEMAGEDSTINDALDQVKLMMLLALIFIYLIMVAQFQSFVSPFIVMFTIPLAFTGGFLGLLVTGMDVSIVSLIGFVMLSGVIVNNGIVLVDYINQLRAEGVEKREAIVLAGKTRMRPIFMTALTTVLGLVTLAMGIGMGSEMVQPMAIVTIGGLLYGTILTLLVVPCIYDIFTGRKIRVIKDEDLELTPEERETVIGATALDESE